MLHQNEATDDRSPDQLDLVEMVLRLQHIAYAVAHVRTSGQPAQKHLSEAWNRGAEQLWYVLRPDLIKLATKWTQSAMGRSMNVMASAVCIEDVRDRLALSAFGYVVMAIPTIRVQPDNNLLACLLTIAQRGLSAEYNQNFRGPSGGKRSSTDEAAPQPGSGQAAMWYTYEEPFGGTLFDGEVLRPASIDDHLEERLVDRLDAEHYVAVVRAYIQRHLKPVDQLIVNQRLFVYPQQTYQQIVHSLGQGWTEMAARQRFKRALQQITRHLHESGLVDDWSLSRC